MRVVAVANFVSPTSGGIKTVLGALARGYVEAGHEPVLVVPGAHDGERRTRHGRLVTLRAPRVGRTGYRMVLDRDRVRAALAALRPDRLEVHDRATLAFLGPWARERGVPAVVLSHERLDALVAQRLGRARGLQRAADAWNRRLVTGFDLVIATTGWALAEFRRIDAPNLHQVPLGVDLEAFGPDRADPALRAGLSPRGLPLLVCCGRLSAEKRPDVAVAAVAALHRKGLPCVLAVAGAGPQRVALERQAAGLGVRFLGHLPGPDAVAALLATADVAIQPGPVETFGLAALEALASGTPVVGARTGAVGEVIGTDGGLTAFSHPAATAAAVRTLLGRPEATRRAAARKRAETFSWDATVAGMLRAHDRAAAAHDDGSRKAVARRPLAAA